jgi:rod shape-determining protein MreD
MTPLDRFLMIVPALIVALLMLCTALPITWMGIALTPNIVWLATMIFARIVPASWPAWLAFSLGLLQDVLFATPLGSQAVIALFLLLAMRARPARIGTPLLRDVWLEACVLLVLAYTLLWFMLQYVLPHPPHVLPLIGAAMVNMLWFPVIAWSAGRLALIVGK